MIDRRLAACIALLAIPAAASAQDATRGADRVLTPFLACRPIADANARATCYDAALDKLRQSVSARQVAIIDRQQAAEDRKSLFGFSADHVAGEPKPPREARERRPAEPNVAEIDSTVTSARQTGYDQWTIRLATGASWRTLEAGMLFPPRVGEEVHIRRGIMGGYLLKVGKSRAMRAMRVR